MAEDVVRFLDSISFLEDRSLLKDLNIEKVLLHKATEVFEVVLVHPKVLPYSLVTALFKASENGIKNKEKCQITLKYQEVTKEDILNYVTELIQEWVLKKPSLVGLLENKPLFEEDTVLLQVGNKTEEREVNLLLKNWIDLLKQFGLGNVSFKVECNSELQKSIQEEIKKDKEEREVVETKPKIDGN